MSSNLLIISTTASAQDNSTDNQSEITIVDRTIVPANTTTIKADVTVIPINNTLQQDSQCALSLLYDAFINMFMEWNALRLIYVEAYGFELRNLVMMDTPN